MNMKIFLILFDIGMAIIFLSIGIYFKESNGKASKYLTGYNTRSNDEKKDIDEVKITKEYGKIYILISLPFFIASIIDSYKMPYGILSAWIIWVIMFVYLLYRRKQNERFKWLK